MKIFLKGYWLISHYSVLPYFDKFTIAKDFGGIFFDEGKDLFNQTLDLGAGPYWGTFIQ